MTPGLGERLGADTLGGIRIIRCPDGLGGALDRVVIDDGSEADRTIVSGSGGTVGVGDGEGGMVGVGDGEGGTDGWSVPGSLGSPSSHVTRYVSCGYFTATMLHFSIIAKGFDLCCVLNWGIVHLD